MLGPWDKGLDELYNEQEKNEAANCSKVVNIKIKENYNNILTIIIPRHISRVQKIKEELSKLNLKIVLSSELSQLDSKTDILLVNSYGEALKFYNISKYVFLGKSLIKSLIKVVLYISTFGEDKKFMPIPIITNFSLLFVLCVSKIIPPNFIF